MRQALQCLDVLARTHKTKNANAHMHLQCSVGELRKFAETHKIGIADCLQKDEIVTRIMRSL